MATLIYNKIIVVQLSILCSWHWHVTPKKTYTKCIVLYTAKWLRERATKLRCVYLAYLVGMWSCLAFQKLTILWCNTLSLIVQLKESPNIIPWKWSSIFFRSVENVSRTTKSTPPKRVNFSVTAMKVSDLTQTNVH